MSEDKIEVGEVFTITDDTEEEHDVEVMATTNIDGTEYIAVSFIGDLEDEEEDDIDVFFLKVDAEGDLEPVESDEEFDKVSAAFDDIFLNHDEE
ncbi:DUF1292 domain-containing protein [Bacillaceae bacterium W0354]